MEFGDVDITLYQEPRLKEYKYDFLLSEKFPYGTMVKRTNKKDGNVSFFVVTGNWTSRSSFGNRMLLETRGIWFSPLVISQLKETPITVPDEYTIEVSSFEEAEKHFILSLEKKIEDYRKMIADFKQRIKDIKALERDAPEDLKEYRERINELLK